MEKVAIHQTNAPQQTRKLPDWNNFWLIPASSPHLREFVLSAEWNYGKKTLSFELKETPAFSAFDWFQKLPNGGSFSSGNNEEIAICFFDDEDHELARLLFTGLSVVDHKCELNDGEENEDDDDLIHEMTLSFDSVCRSRVNNESLEEVHNKFHEDAIKAADAEWQDGQRQPEPVFDHSEWPTLENPFVKKP